MQPREEAVRRQAGAARAEPGPRSLRGLQGPVARSRSSRTWAASRCPARRARRRRPSSRSWPAIGHDIAKTRAEATPPAARRPACPTASRSRSRTAASRMPYEPLGIWLIDQWRQIGLNVKMEMIEAGAYHPMLKRGDFEVAMDFQCGYIVEPDLDLLQFPQHVRRQLRPPQGHGDRRPVQPSRVGPPIPRSARSSCGSSRSGCSTTRRTYIYTLQWHRIIPHLRQGEGLDDHPESLPEQPARYGLALGVGRRRRRAPRGARP